MSDMTPDEQLATLLTSTPSARAKLFTNPTRYVGRSMPPNRYWNYKGVSSSWWLPKKWIEFRRARRELATKVLGDISDRIGENGVASAVNTDAVFEEFFTPIVKTSQRSFTSVFMLSWAAFFAGLGLIGVGSYLAIYPPTNVDSTVVSSIFGGSGAISALGAVYTMAKQGIREATLDHARLRMVLTGFATQLGQLRALAEAATKPDDASIATAKDINAAVTDAMNGALKNLPSIAEPSLADGGPTHAGTSGPSANGGDKKSPDGAGGPATTNQTAE
jgi:hypothetical protein